MWGFLWGFVELQSQNQAFPTAYKRKSSGILGFMWSRECESNTRPTDYEEERVRGPVSGFSVGGAPLPFRKSLHTVRIEPTRSMWGAPHFKILIFFPRFFGAGRPGGQNQDFRKLLRDRKQPKYAFTISEVAQDNDLGFYFCGFPISPFIA